MLFFDILLLELLEELKTLRFWKRLYMECSLGYSIIEWEGLVALLAVERRLVHSKGEHAKSPVLPVLDSYPALAVHIVGMFTWIKGHKRLTAGTK